MKKNPWFIIFPVLLLLCETGYAQQLYKEYTSRTRMRTVETVFNVKDHSYVLKADPSFSFQQGTAQQFGFIPVKKNGKWGIIDSVGNTVTAFDYDSIYPVHAFAGIENYESYTAGIIEEHKESRYSSYIYQKLQPLEYLWHLWVLEKKGNDRRYTIYNPLTRVASIHEFTQLWIEYSEADHSGYLFGKHQGKKAVIGPDAGFLVPPDFDNVDLFTVSRGPIAKFTDGTYFRVYKDWRYGIYKSATGLINNNTYDHVTLWKVTSNSWERSALFLHGFTFFSRGGKQGLIDSTGKELLLPEYDSMKRGLTPDSYITIFKDGQYGFYSLAESRIVLPVSYKLAEEERNRNDYYYRYSDPSEYYGRFNNNFCVIEENGSTGVINKKGELVVPMKENCYMYADRHGYLYSRLDTAEYWSLSYIPTGKVIHTELSYYPAQNEFSYPVLDSIGLVIQDKEKMKLVSNEGQTLYTFSMVGCEGPFKVYNRNVIRDRNDFFEVSSSGKVSKLPIIKSPVSDGIETGVMVTNASGSHCIIQDPSYRLEMRTLPKDVKWKKKQDLLDKGLLYDFGIIEKDKKYGLYHFRTGVIAVPPTFRSLKEVEKYLYENPFDEFAVTGM